jgi:hypothetical protein
MISLKAVESIQKRAVQGGYMEKYDPTMSQRDPSKPYNQLRPRSLRSSGSELDDECQPGNAEPPELTSNDTDIPQSAFQRFREEEEPNENE